MFELNIAMDLKRRGRAWKFGDHVVPDTAIGWTSEMDGWSPERLAAVFMVKIDPEIPHKIRKGDLIVAGRNFGYGRAHRAFWGSLKTVGIAGIVAESFSPQFFKSAIGSGLPILECAGITRAVDQGDELEVNFKTGEIENLTTGKSIRVEPLHDFQLRVLEAGGFIAYFRERLQGREANPSIDKENL